MTELDLGKVGEIIRQAKTLAVEYYELTGRPLGITGEVAEYEAARLLNLQLSPARQPGYDATYEDAGVIRRVQIKGRRILKESKPGQRVGRIDLKYEWDEVLLVLLDEALEPISIHRAQRASVEAALKAPGSRARNERGALGANKFKSISELVWKRS